MSQAGKQFPPSKLFSTEVRNFLALSMLQWQVQVPPGFEDGSLLISAMLEMNLMIFDSFQKILSLIDPKWQGHLPPSSLFRCRRSFALLTFHDAMNGPTVAKKRDISITNFPDLPIDVCPRLCSALHCDLSLLQV